MEQNDPRLDLKPAEFCRSLSESECSLIYIRDDLYESSWERMERDLRDRLQGKPYIFKLVNKIESDVQTIGLLREYERKNAIDLRGFLDRE